MLRNLSIFMPRGTIELLNDFKFNSVLESNSVRLGSFVHFVAVVVIATLLKTPNILLSYLFLYLLFLHTLSKRIVFIIAMRFFKQAK